MGRPKLEYSEGMKPELKPELKKLGRDFFSLMYGPLVPITDDVAQDLIRGGMSPDKVVEAREMGLWYSAKRDSFTWPEDG
jgi:hypothetical protein